jgi:hypothetical protein
MSLSDSPEIQGYSQEKSFTRKPRRTGRNSLRLFLAVVMVLLAGLLLVLWVDQQDFRFGHAAVFGVVVDPAGQPVPDAEIFISGVDSWVGSSEDGSFVFDRVPAGEHVVVVVVTPGPVNSEVLIPVDLSAGESVDLGTIIFGLPASPSSGGAP